MRKWKLLLSTLGIITPLAISTPFIVGCSGKERTLNIETPTKFINIEFSCRKINSKTPLNVYVKMYRNEDDYNRMESTTQIGDYNIETKQWEKVFKLNIYYVKLYYMQAIDAGYTPIMLYSF